MRVLYELADYARLKNLIGAAEYRAIRDLLYPDDPDDWDSYIADSDDVLERDDDESAVWRAGSESCHPEAEHPPQRRTRRASKRAKNPLKASAIEADLASRRVEWEREREIIDRLATLAGVSTDRAARDLGELAGADLVRRALESRAVSLDDLLALVLFSGIHYGIDAALKPEETRLRAPIQIDGRWGGPAPRAYLSVTSILREPVQAERWILRHPTIAWAHHVARIQRGILLGLVQLLRDAPATLDRPIDDPDTTGYWVMCGLLSLLRPMSGDSISVPAPIRPRAPRGIGTALRRWAAATGLRKFAGGVLEIQEIAGDGAYLPEELLAPFLGEEHMNSCVFAWLGMDLRALPGWVGRRWKGWGSVEAIITERLRKALANSRTTGCLDLSSDPLLTTFAPKPSLFAHVREVDLSGCRSLREVTPQMARLNGLEFIRLDGCEELRRLPMEIADLPRLRHISFNMRFFEIPDLALARIAERAGY